MSCVLKATQYAGSLALAASDNTYDPSKLSFIYFAGFYAFMAVVTVSYPIGGFLADVYCGRYKTVNISMAIIWTALFLLCVAVILNLSFQHHIPHAVQLVQYILCGIAFLLSIPALAGFYSNMTQLSLDQLRDAPSHTLGIFLHWNVWVDLLGSTLVHIVFVVVGCFKSAPEFKDVIDSVAYCLPLLLLLLVSVLMVVNCFTKHWFYAADINYNPYKMVLDVLKYVRTHKYPTYHSAMHWTNGEQPSRFDFAKDCYGGPFTSPQVEDVKTLGRVVLVLLAVGPVFVLCVPTSYFIFPFFSFHVSKRSTHQYCQAKWILIESGTLSYLIGLVTLPIVTWVVYCVLKNRVPKILSRMTVGIILFILGVFSMLVIDVVGHFTTPTTGMPSNMTHCLFLESYKLGDNNPYYHFKHFHWYILVIPNCFNVVSYSLIIVTVFEFISAQAPQPMKGLVFGMFFAIKGGYNFIAAASLLPFSLKSFMVSSPYVSCGTSYFLLTVVVSLVGLVLFACASRRYKYRMRDEEPFCQAVVEEIFDRRLQHNADESLLESPDIVPGSSGGSRVSVRRQVRVTESEEERVRASEWFVVHGEGQSRGSEPERLLSLSHDWYGTFQYNDSERRTD